MWKLEHDRKITRTNINHCTWPKNRWIWPKSISEKNLLRQQTWTREYDQKVHFWSCSTGQCLSMWCFRSCTNFWVIFIRSSWIGQMIIPSYSFLFLRAIQIWLFNKTSKGFSASKQITLVVGLEIAVYM